MYSSIGTHHRLHKVPEENMLGGIPSKLVIWYFKASEEIKTSRKPCVNLYKQNRSVARASVQNYELKSVTFPPLSSWNNWYVNEIEVSWVRFLPRLFYFQSMKFRLFQEQLFTGCCCPRKIGIFVCLLSKTGRACWDISQHTLLVFDINVHIYHVCTISINTLSTLIKKTNFLQNI